MLRPIHGRRRSVGDLSRKRWSITCRPMSVATSEPFSIYVPGDERPVGDAKRDRPAAPSRPLDEELRQAEFFSSTPALWFEPARASRMTGYGAWPSRLRSAPQAPGAT